jgi:hypothetical protein
MLHGVAREMGLGKYPDVSLARARELAAAARAVRATGKNPIVERANASAVSFKGCAERYIADRKEGWKNAKHAQQWTATLEQYAYPKLGQVPVSAVDTALVVAVLKPIWRSKPEPRSEYAAGSKPSWTGPRRTGFAARRIRRVGAISLTCCRRNSERLSITQPCRWASLPAS